jgi:entry exclusion lipoprotein TrbK
MKMINWAVPLLPLLLIAGCESNVSDAEVSQIPEANGENCLPEKVAELRTQDLRERMSSLCLRESNFNATEPRQW